MKGGYETPSRKTKPNQCSQSTFPQGQGWLESWQEECPHILGILKSSGLTVFPGSEMVIFSPSGLPPTFPDSQKVDECQRLGHPGPFLVTAQASKTLPQVPIGQRVSHPS